MVEGERQVSGAGLTKATGARSAIFAIDYILLVSDRGGCPYQYREDNNPVLRSCSVQHYPVTAEPCSYCSGSVVKDFCGVDLIEIAVVN